MNDKLQNLTASELTATQGGDYVEYGFGWIYGIGAFATVSGIGLAPIVLAGATLLLYDMIADEL